MFVAHGTRTVLRRRVVREADGKKPGSFRLPALVIAPSIDSATN
jgi:hypothetical protein